MENHDAMLKEKPNLEQFHHYSGGKAVGVFDSRIADYIIKNYSIFVCGIPYLYVNGVYVQDRNGTKMKQIIKGLMYEQFIKHSKINQIYYLILETEELQKTFDSLNDYPRSYINFKDCMLDAETMEKLPHDPNYYSINQVPYNYSDIEKAANGTEIENFFGYIFSSDDDRKMLLEYAGLCLTRDTRQQRFMILCGIGGTGKSVLIRLIEHAAGNENVSNVSMHKLNERFSTSLLVGKTLNSCGDLSIEELTDSSTIKRLLGEDSIMAEFKGKDGFMFKNYSKLLFSTNTLPTVSTEHTNGFYRRLLILKMDKQPERPDPDLADRLLDETWYFLKLSVEALHEMYQRKEITVSEKSKEAVKQMWTDSDVVQAWLNDRCIIEAHLRTGRMEAYVNFKQYCMDEERPALTKNAFYNVLRAKNFSEGRNRNERFFIGFSVKKESQDNGK